MKCKNCENELKSKRNTAKFCSAKCRVSWHRKPISVTVSVTDKPLSVTKKRVSVTKRANKEVSVTDTKRKTWKFNLKKGIWE